MISGIIVYWNTRKWPLRESGVPSGPISELLYPIDFRPYSFRRRTRISSKDVKTIVEMYQNGCSLTDVAKLVRRSKDRVRNELLRNGIEPRGRMTRARDSHSLKSAKPSARLHYGFCYFEGHIVKDPREYPTLKLIHHHWVNGKTVQGIRVELNRAKIPSRSCKRWSWAAVKSVVDRFKDKTVVLQKGEGV